MYNLEERIQKIESRNMKIKIDKTYEKNFINTMRDFSLFSAKFS